MTPTKNDDEAREPTPTTIDPDVGWPGEWGDWARDTRKPPPPAEEPVSETAESPERQS